MLTPSQAMQLMQTLRTIQLVAAILLVGGPAFWLLVWRPALQDVPEGERRAALALPLRHWMAFFGTLAALVVVAAAAVDLLRLASQLARAPFFANDTFSMLGTIVQASLPGKMAVARIVVALLLLALRPWRGRVPDAIISLLCVSLLATFSLSGHAMATSGSPVLPVLSDLLHTVATAVWYGGLWYFALIPWRSVREEANLPVLARTVNRFSGLGLIAVLILSVSGVYMALLRLYGAMALIEHPYGSTLMQKLVFLVGVLALAAVNHFWVKGRLGTDASPKVGRLLRWLVSGEVLLGMGVLVLAGMLSTTAPPQGEPDRRTIILTEFHFDPEVVEVARGKPVKLTVVNVGTIPHSYVIRAMPHDAIGKGHDHGDSQDMHIVAYPGVTQIVSFVPRRAGTYEVYCMVAGHLEEGEVGLFVVK